MGRGEKNQSPFSNSFSIYCYEVHRRTGDPFSFLFFSFVFFLSLFLFVCFFLSKRNSLEAGEATKAQDTLYLGVV